MARSGASRSCDASDLGCLVPVSAGGSLAGVIAGGSGSAFAFAGAFGIASFAAACTAGCSGATAAGASASWSDCSNLISAAAIALSSSAKGSGGGSGDGSIGFARKTSSPGGSDGTGRNVCASCDMASARKSSGSSAADGDGVTGSAMIGAAGKGGIGEGHKIGLLRFRFDFRYLFQFGFEAPQDFRGQLGFRRGLRQIFQDSSLQGSGCFASAVPAGGAADSMARSANLRAASASANTVSETNNCGRVCPRR